ncbi:TIR domain-containing protein [Agrococcus sediminis]|uniref:TIR domain-containing protein n=1 Tax=Agrococcus sediminis TaxID=2599924 RepID=UPI0034328A99
MHAQQHKDVDPRGPIFISYRQSDGTRLANDISRLLRAAGVPVWRDATDLPPGDTEGRLRQAMQSGLSGAVLIVTPDIARSRVVRNIELPGLLKLERDPAFSFMIANHATPGAPLDFGAPDRLLERPAGALSRINQMPAESDQDLSAIVRAVLMHRVDALRQDPAAASALVVDVRTRAAAHSADRNSHIPIRLLPQTSGRLPSRQALDDLKLTLPLLPEAVERSKAVTVRVTGAAHLSVALAIGCALPATLVPQLTVDALDGQSWAGATVAASGETLELTRITGHQSFPGERGRAVAAFVDLVPGRSDNAWGEFMTGNAGQFAEAVHIELLERQEIDPDLAPVLTAEIAGLLRALSRRNGGVTLHVLLYAPFPVAVLLGRLMNTFSLVAYEFDSSQAAPAAARERYVPAIAITPTNGANLISEVLLPVNDDSATHRTIWERIIDATRALRAVRKRCQ